MSRDVITRVITPDLPLTDTIPGTGNDGGSPCVFPFIYRNEVYTACTMANHNALWCATTSNYDLDARWGNCVVSNTTGILLSSFLAAGYWELV